MALLARVIRLAVEAGILRGVAMWVGEQDRWRRRLIRLVTGAAWLLVATFLGAWAVVAAVSSIFFRLADLPTFVVPALLTAGVLLLTTLLAVLVGWQKLTRP